MLPCDARAIRPGNAGAAPTALEKSLRLVAVLSMLMTVPQVVSVWSARADGVSLVSWLAYLVSSLFWLAYGIQKRDATIYLAFGGWVLLDAAIVAGIIAGR